MMDYDELTEYLNEHSLDAEIDERERRDDERAHCDEDEI